MRRVRPGELGVGGGASGGDQAGGGGLAARAAAVDGGPQVLGSGCPPPSLPPSGSNQ